MYYTNDEVKKVLTRLTKTALADVGIAEGSKKYLSEVSSRDLDNAHNMLNIWCGLYQDLTGFSPSILKEYINRRGLVTVIREAKDLRLEFIKADFSYNIFNPGTPWFYFHGTLGKCVPVEHVLMLLGFPKRTFFEKANLGEIAFGKVLAMNKKFSEYPEKDDIPTHDFRDWHFHPLTLSQETNNKMWTADVCRYDYIRNFILKKGITEVRHFNFTKAYCLHLVKKYALELIPDILPELDCFRLPPGSTYELSGKNSTYWNKYVVMSLDREFVSKFMNLPDHYFAPVPACSDIEKIGRLIPVPKDVSNYRTVMPEEVARQFLAYAYADAIEKSLMRRPYTMNYISMCKDYTWFSEYPEEAYTFGGIDLHNQLRNQLAARIGSITNMLATVDYSQASDSISVALIEYIWPKLYKEFIQHIRSEWIEVGSRRVRSNIAFTMGFVLTFLFESCIFTAVLRAATTLAWNFAPKSSRQFFKNINRALASCFSYGDDGIVPSFAVDAVRMVSEHLGLTMNEEKSFADSPYRESCGEEYYNGSSVAHSYFPRGTSHTKLAELIGLQHKLYQYGSANAFIIQKCCEYRTHLTYNMVGSKHMDLWGWVQPPVKYCSPYAQDYEYLKADGRYWPLIREGYTWRIGTQFHKKLWQMPLKNIHFMSFYVREEQYRSTIAPKLVAQLLLVKPVENPGLISTQSHPLFRKGRDVLSGWKVVTGTTRGVDKEPYVEATVPTVTYSGPGEPNILCDYVTKARDGRPAISWDFQFEATEVDRLAYVMSLFEMSRRRPMSTDDYLDFMVDRDPVQKFEYGSERGYIDYARLRQSLTSASTVKLERKLVPAQD